MKENPNELPIHKAHDETRSMLNTKLSYSSEKVNLRSALEASLNSSESIIDIAKQHINNFEKMNSFEQEITTEYVLVADLLKRQLWKDLKDNIVSFVESGDFFNTQSIVKNGESLEEQKAKGKLSWDKVIDTSTQIIGESSLAFFYDWENKMKTEEKDGMYKKRFDELDAVCRLRNEKYSTGYTPQDLMRLGFATGIEYPMGMLKHMPALLAAAGKEITVKNINDTFSKNLVSVTSQYASQDILSFQAIQSSLDPSSRSVGDYQPADFPPTLFLLDENDKMQFNKEAFSKIFQKLQNNVDQLSASTHIKINKLVNHAEQKNNNQNVQVPWKGCPIMFGNLVTDLEHFFKPILERLTEIQEEYS